VRHAGPTLQRLVPVHARVLALFSATALYASSQCDLSLMLGASPTPLMLSVLSLPKHCNKNISRISIFCAASLFSKLWQVMVNLSDCLY